MNQNWRKVKYFSRKLFHLPPLDDIYLSKYTMRQRQDRKKGRTQHANTWYCIASWGLFHVPVYSFKTPLPFKAQDIDGHSVLNQLLSLNSNFCLSQRSPGPLTESALVHRGHSVYIPCRVHDPLLYVWIGVVCSFSISSTFVKNGSTLYLVLALGCITCATKSGNSFMRRIFSK